MLIGSFTRKIRGLLTTRRSGTAVPLEAVLDRGWHQLESHGDMEWAWSLAEARLQLPPGTADVSLTLSTIYADLTGRPQPLAVLLDGVEAWTGELGPGIHELHLRGRGKRTLTLHTAVARPCDHGHRGETRQLGVCLLICRLGGKVRLADAPPAPDAPIPNAPPDHLQVEITTACHLACKMCARSATALRGAPQQMSERVWQRFLEAASGVTSVNFLGTGEPFTHPKFIDALQELDQRGVRTSIATSGDLISAPKATALGRLQGLQRITFSIDSPDPAVYEAIRGQPLERPLAALDRVMAALPDPGRVRIMAVIMRNNIESLRGFPALLRRHGVQQLVLRGVVDNSGIAALVPEYDARDRAILREVREACMAGGVTLSIVPPVPSDLIHTGTADLRDEQPSSSPSPPPPACPSVRLCYDPWEMAVITREGLVYPCQVYNAMEPVGSLAEQDFTSIWRGERFNTFRRRLLGDRSLTCRNCPRRHLGTHAFHKFGAERVEGPVPLGDGRWRLVVRNIGRAAWTAATPLHIGTARPKDRPDSPQRHEGWISANRVAAPREQTVAPGSVATFEFSVAPSSGAGAGRQAYQLVVEGERWLPGTVFELGSDG